MIWQSLNKVLLYNCKVNHICKWNGRRKNREDVNFTGRNCIFIDLNVLVLNTLYNFINK